jgi:hypothetical protein
MKTLTTLTAIAALVAGLSIANAQTATPKSGANSGAMGSSSTSSNMGQQAATGSGKFCIETSAGGSLNCKYANLAACQKDAKAQNLNCAPNPNSGTTGAK